MKKFIIGFLLIVFIRPLIAQRPTVLTESAMTLGKGRCTIGFGAEYYRKDQAPASDLLLSEWRLMDFAAHFGVADNVDFNLDWRGRLIGKLESGETDSDWGDLTVSTHINIVSEDSSRPAFGFRTAVKLPNTKYLPYHLGSDNTDFFFTLLLSNHFNNIKCMFNAGVGILGDPEARGGQDDMYYISGAALVPVFTSSKIFLEGFTVFGPRDHDNKFLLRVGLSQDCSFAVVNVYGSYRVAGDNIDFATAFEATEDWSVGIFLSKEIHF